MRSRIEGFDVVEIETTSDLAYAVTYYGVKIAYFCSYADCMLHIVHWTRCPDSFAHVLNYELDAEDMRIIFIRLDGCDREALIKRQRRHDVDLQNAICDEQDRMAMEDY